MKRLNLIDSVNVQDGKIIIIFRGRSYIINHETELLNMFPKIDFKAFKLSFLGISPSAFCLLL